jgi:CheY-like chemotaxis protein
MLLLLQTSLLQQITQHNKITKKKFRKVSEEKTGVMMKIILVVNDDEAQAWLLAHTILRERRYNTLFAGGCSEALYFVQHIIPHLFIFDYRASPSKGLECYDSLPAMASLTSIPTIFISANSEQIEYEVKTRNLVLLEPSLEISKLLDIVDQLLM